MESNRPVAKRSGQAEAEVLPRGEKENDMDKLFTLTLAIVVCLGTTALLGTSRAVQEKSPTNSQMAADGAFRDGLYQGRLAAEAGRPVHVQVGRWSTERDRTSFAMGYRRGYNDVLASTAAATPQE